MTFAEECDKLVVRPAEEPMHRHHSPCRYYKEIGLCSYCTAVKPMRSLPDCDFGTESNCGTGKYEPTHLYQELYSGTFVFGLDIVGPDYILISENV